MVCKNCGTYVPDNSEKCPSCYMPIIKEEYNNSLVQRNKLSNEIVEEPIVIKQPIIVEKAIIVEQPLGVEQPIVEDNIVEVVDFEEDRKTEDSDDFLTATPLKLDKNEKNNKNKVLLIVGISLGVLLLIGAIVGCIIMLTASNMDVKEENPTNVKEEIKYKIEEVETKDEKEEKKTKEDKEDKEVKEGETSDIEEDTNDTVIVGEHLTLQVNEEGKVRSNRFAKGLKLAEDYIIEGYYLPAGVYSIKGNGVWDMLRPFGIGKNRKWESVGTIESQNDNLVYMSYSDKEMKKDVEHRVGEITAKNPTITVELTKETYFTTYGKSATLTIEKIKEYEAPVVKEEEKEEVKETNNELQKEQPIEKLDNSKIICEYIVGLGVIDNDFAREISVKGEMKYGYVIPKGTYRIEGGTKDAYLVLVRNIKYEGKKQNIEYGAIEVKDKNVSYYLYDTKYIASEEDLPLSILQEEGKSVIIEFDNDIFVYPNGRNGQIKFILVD